MRTGARRPETVGAERAFDRLGCMVEVLIYVVVICSQGGSSNYVIWWKFRADASYPWLIVARFTSSTAHHPRPFIARRRTAAACSASTRARSARASSARRRGPGRRPRSGTRAHGPSRWAHATQRPHRPGAARAMPVVAHFVGRGMGRRTASCRKIARPRVHYSAWHDWVGQVLHPCC